MQIIKRDQWKALGPKYPLRPMSSFIDGWVWHYNGPRTSITEGSTQEVVAAFLRGIQRFHQNEQGWSDIAYSFAVDQAGRVYECRGWGARGAHTDGFNSTSMAIFFTIGEGQTPTPKALQAAEWLMLEGVKHGWDSDRARPHSELVATSCPGDALRDYLASRNRPFRCTHPLGCEGEIQQVLTDLAKATGDPRLDPGGVDGKIGPNTTRAIHTLKNLYQQR